VRTNGHIPDKSIKGMLTGTTKTTTRECKEEAKRDNAWAQNARRKRSGRKAARPLNDEKALYQNEPTVARDGLSQKSTKEG